MAGTLNLKSNPQLNSQEQKIVDRLIETEALKFGEFRLKSGRLAPFFLNVGDLGAGRELAMIADAYTTLIRREFASETGELHFDVLYGPTYKHPARGGDCYAPIRALQSQRPLLCGLSRN